MYNEDKYKKSRNIVLEHFLRDQVVVRTIFAGYILELSSRPNFFE